MMAQSLLRVYITTRKKIKPYVNHYQTSQNILRTVHTYI